MAFEYTIKTHDFLGKGIVVGTWTATGVTTGSINSGFGQIDHMDWSNAISDTNTCKASAGTAEITCTSGDSGTFMIYGQ